MRLSELVEHERRLVVGPHQERFRVPLERKTGIDHATPPAGRGRAADVHATLVPEC